MIPTKRIPEKLLIIEKHGTVFTEQHGTVQYEQIKRDSKMFVPTDRSRNVYQIGRETHEKLLHENITKTYKKTDKMKVRAIDIKREGFRTLI